MNCLGIGLDEPFTMENLRRLGLIETLAGDGGLDPTVSVGPFDSTMDRFTENGRTVRASRPEDAIEIVGRDEGASSIVNRNPFHGRLHPCQGVLHTLPSFVTSQDDLDSHHGYGCSELAAKHLPIIGMNDQICLGDGRVLREHRHAVLKDWLSPSSAKTFFSRG